MPHMSVRDADTLQQLFEQQQSLTTWHEIAVQRAIELWRAMRENDVDTLRARAGWNADRDYVPDSLAEKISMTFAEMLFGEDPIIKSAETVAKEMALATSSVEGTLQEAAQDDEEAREDEGGPTEESQGNLPIEPVGSEDGEDQDRLNNLVEANELPAELFAAEVTCSSEGEVWWRIYVDRGQSDYPIIEWHSRSHVRPLFRGRKLIAAAFVSEIHREQINDQWIIYRYVEIHSDSIVRNILYKGTPTNLGTEIPLTSRPETEQLDPEWLHDLGMLCGRIYNKLGRDRRVGKSDYHNVVDLLFSLNEATTIGHENVRLTAKKRIAVPREALGEGGTFDASEDVLVMDEPLDDQLGAKTAGGKFAVLEYSFDATALIQYKLDLMATILSRVGIVAEFANAGGGTRSSGGGGEAALSGTALRLRFIPTTLAAKGKARPWDSQLPKILMLAQQVDALPEERQGFGRPWNEAAQPPSVERGEPLPTDETEETTRHVSAVGGTIESRRTAISELHPTWDDRQVQQELDEIQAEMTKFGPPPSSNGGSGITGKHIPGADTPRVGVSAGMDSEQG